jgi:hypothetical protein
VRGRPSRLISDDDIQLIVTTATTRLEKLGLPFRHWSLRKLTAWLAGRTARPLRIGRERLRQILHGRGISFQRTRTWPGSLYGTSGAPSGRFSRGKRSSASCMAFKLPYR